VLRAQASGGAGYPRAGAFAQHARLLRGREGAEQVAVPARPLRARLWARGGGVNPAPEHAGESRVESAAQFDTTCMSKAALLCILVEQIVVVGEHRQSVLLVF
jgi:hypothetical protein